MTVSVKESLTGMNAFYHCGGAYKSSGTLEMP